LSADVLRKLRKDYLYYFGPNLRLSRISVAIVAYFWSRCAYCHAAETKTEIEKSTEHQTMIALTGHDTLTLAIALILAGGVTGFLAGLFGVGGGAIIVPILYQTFVFVGVPDALRMPLTVGTSLAVIIPTAVTSYIAHRKKGAVDDVALRLWAIPCVIGVIVGSAMASFAPAALFKIVFASVSATVGLWLLLGGQRWRLSDDLPRPWPMRMIGLVIGVLSALMGISGGMLTNMMMLLLGSSIHQAVATSAGLGVFISIPGAIGYAIAGWPHMDALPPLSLGYVSIPGAILLSALAMWVAPLGARLAHAIPRRCLEVAFAIYLLTMAARFFIALAY
jgi:uncharacterized membrane protein YfcA